MTETGESRAAPAPALLKGFGVTALLYAIAVLAIDTLAVTGNQSLIDWSVFHRNIELTILESLTGNRPGNEWSQFDTFKFIAWFLIPLALSLYRIDLGYFGVKRWKKPDLAVLAILIVLGAGAVLLIPLFPSLDRMYTGLSDRPADVRWAYTRGFFLWQFSWLLGWEFLLRYFLLRRLNEGFGPWACAAIPILEFVYHLQKPFAEALLAGGGGAVLTFWALKRKNVLLPFLAHLSIELALLVFMLVR